MSTPDLSDVLNVSSYLAGTPFASGKVAPLSGGTANYVFRIYLNQPFDGQETMIFKHSKAHASLNKNIPLALERQEIEAVALLQVKKFMPEDALVTVPKVYHYDKDAHVLVIEDCGPDSRTLKEFLIDNPNFVSGVEARELGSALGSFIRTVHNEGTKDKDLMDFASRNVEMRKLTAWVTYGSLIDTLTGSGKRPIVFEPPLNLSSEDLETLQRLVAQVVDGITHSCASFTMGDFWTGNAIVQAEPDTSVYAGDDSDSPKLRVKVKRVFVVDWEFCKPGLAYLDVGQFAAELHTAQAFYKGPDGRSAVDEVLPAFLRAYNAHGDMKMEDIKRTAVHIGAHMAVVTPGVSIWRPKDAVREFVADAVEYLLKGDRGDLDWLKSSIVANLLEESNG